MDREGIGPSGATVDRGAPVTRPGPIGPLSERALFLKPLTSRCEGVADFQSHFHRAYTSLEILEP